MRQDMSRFRKCTYYGCHDDFEKCFESCGILGDVAGIAASLDQRANEHTESASNSLRRGMRIAWYAK